MMWQPSCVQELGVSALLCKESGATSIESETGFRAAESQGWVAAHLLAYKGTLVRWQAAEARIHHW